MKKRCKRKTSEGRVDPIKKRLLLRVNFYFAGSTSSKRHRRKEGKEEEEEEEEEEETKKLKQLQTYLTENPFLSLASSISTWRISGRSSLLI